MHICASEILKWKFLENNSEIVVNLMKSLIEFVSACFNFSPTADPIALAIYTVQCPPHTCKSETW